MTAWAACALGLWGGVAVAAAPERDPGQLMSDAETAYREGRLDDAQHLLAQVIQADPAMSGARRLLIEIALRQGEADLASEALDQYEARRGNSPSERAWISRGRQRLAVDLAEQRGDLPRAMAGLEQLEGARGSMRPSELSWLNWTEAKVKVRLAEVEGDTRTASDAILEMRRTLNVQPGSPEEKWLNQAEVRMRFAEAERSCQWHRASGALNQFWNLPSPQGASALYWAKVAEQRLALRAAVSETGPSGAAEPLAHLLSLPDLRPEDRVWAQGYGAWLEREAAVREGGAPTGAVLEQLAVWREAFPYESGCELAPQSAGILSREGSFNLNNQLVMLDPNPDPWLTKGAPRTGPRDELARPSALGRRSEDSGVQARGVAVVEAPDPDARPPALEVAAEFVVGVLQWKYTPAEAEETTTEESKTDLGLGLGLDLDWAPVQLSSKVRGGLTGDLAVRTMTDFYVSNELWLGLSATLPAARVALVGGVRTASRDRESCETTDCSSGDESSRLTSPLASIAAQVELWPAAAWSVSVRAGGGPGNLNYFDKGALADVAVHVAPIPDRPVTFGAAWGGTWGVIRSGDERPGKDDQVERSWSRDQWIVCTVGVSYGRLTR